METKATIKLVLDTRKTDNDKKVVKIRITFNRKPQLYRSSTKIRLTKEEFNNPRLKTTKMALEEAQQSLDIANEIVEELGTRFSFIAFGELYTKKMNGIRGDKALFSTLANEYLVSNNLKASTLKDYQTALNWLYDFRNGPRLDEMTCNFVQKFISHVKDTHKKKHKKEISENSIRIYLRELKSIYNDGIKKGWAKEPNPFIIKGQPLTSISRDKRALTDEEWEAFRNYTPKNKLEEMGKDFFILSIQMCGANMGDIISLKNKSIKDDEIYFIRRKTIKSGTAAIPPLTTTTLNILNKYGVVNPEKPDDYILPYLAKCENEKSIDNKIHDTIRKINKGIKSICEALSITAHITTYNARHTYGAYAQDVLTPSQAQKFFGHTSSRTTEQYFKDITKHVKEKNKIILNKIMGQ